jgi:glucokinase
MTAELILAGDIGGTNARFVLAAPADGAPVRDARYRVADLAGPADAIAHFLEAAGTAGARIACAVLAVAGPIVGRSAQLTNAPWLVDADALARRFGIPDVRLVNDFAAAASGIDALVPSQLAVLQTGDAVPLAPRLVIGAGTGLGVGYLVHDGRAYRVVPGEGGHVGFAPADAEQAALWSFLHDRLGRVQAEDVVSGTGLVNIYTFLLARRGADLPLDVRRDGGAAVTRRALDAAEPEALHAIDLFVRCFGAAAGDQALSILARGGVYLAGGIAPKLVERLRSGGFLEAFNAKGSHAAIVRRMPVCVVMEERLGLFGAARIAAALATGPRNAAD